MVSYIFMTLIEQILETILEIAELTPKLFEGKYQYAQRLKRATYYGTISRMQKQGLIKKKKIGSRNSYSITTKGLEYKVKSQPQYVLRTDGMLTGVIFDIPETEKKKRAVFRHFLRTTKFRKLQKSVFVNEYWPLPEVSEMIKRLEVEEYVIQVSIKILR